MKNPVKEASQPIEKPIESTGLEASNEEPAAVTYPRDLTFWLIFVTLCVCSLFAALDTGGIATAAPTIITDLGGSASNSFIWVSSAYSISSAAIIPLSGNVADVFGRRSITFVGVVLFAAGSAVSGAAVSIGMLIAGRVIQGLGSGILQALSNIIVTDLVSLRDRGLFSGLLGLTIALGAIIGPLISGALAQKASWRWIFYINLPLCGIASFVVLKFLKLRSPEGDMWKKLRSIDWTGNSLIMASSISFMLAITWGGVQFAWTSPRTLVPLIVGAIGFILAIVYEAWIPSQPSVPLVLFTNRNSFLGYMAGFLGGLAIIELGFYLPTFFQASRTADPIRSGVNFLPLTVSLPLFGILQGVYIQKTGQYLLINIIGWTVSTIGFGLLISVKVTTSLGLIVLYQIIVGIGLGLTNATTFAVLATLPISLNAAAVSMLIFLRIFSQAWGAAVGGTILQNRLQAHLPPDVLNSLPAGTQLAYSLIPKIHNLPPTVQFQVKEIFTSSLRGIWISATAFVGLATILVLGLKNVPLRKSVDTKYGIDRDSAGNVTGQPIDLETK